MILAAAAAFAAYFFLLGGGQEKRYEQHMEAGRTYLEEEAFEEAVAEFEEAIEINENVVEPYQLMAQAYIGLEDDEKADETYDTVRGLIVAAYEESEGEEILTDAKELYLEAVAYYDEQGNTEKADEVISEILVILPDDEDIQEIVSERNEQDANIQGESGIADETAEKPDAENILEMLEPCAHQIRDILYDWYEVSDSSDNLDLWLYENISDAEALELAARAICETELYKVESDSYPYVDGHIYNSEELSQAQQENVVNYYFSVPDGLYEQYIADMFGLTPDMSEVSTVFASYDFPTAVQEDGKFYFVIGEYGEDFVEISIKNISETPDSDGAYTVLVQYQAVAEWDDPESVLYTYYMEYRIVQSDESEYGCVILGMTPAGNQLLLE